MKYALDAVRALVVRANLRLSLTKAKQPLLTHCGSLAAGLVFARRVICALTPQCYSETVLQSFGLELDVHGIRDDGVLWYIKFAIEIDDEGEERLNVLSFHPAKQPIRTKGGLLK